MSERHQLCWLAACPQAPSPLGVSVLSCQPRVTCSMQPNPLALTLSESESDPTLAPSALSGPAPHPGCLRQRVA